MEGQYFIGVGDIESTHSSRAAAILSKNRIVARSNDLSGGKVRIIGPLSLDELEALCDLGLVGDKGKAALVVIVGAGASVAAVAS